MLSIPKLNEFFSKEFPQAEFTIEDIGDKTATIKQEIGHQHLRPGGTVSGPTIMGLADAALYVTVLNEIGLVALAVTTNLNINFLRKPANNQPLYAKCQLIKLGKSLAVGDVFIYSGDNDMPVAHATGTYSIPPTRSV